RCDARRLSLQVGSKPMPIRFRCAYCNQLLGIARRKAGQVVRCPTCAGQVVVPQADEESPEQELPSPGPVQAPAQAPSAPLFERDDFGLDFDNPVPSMPPTQGSGSGSGSGAAAAAAPPAPAPAWGAPPGVGFDVEPLRSAPDVAEGPRGGIV